MNISYKDTNSIRLGDLFLFLFFPTVNDHLVRSQTALCRLKRVRKNRIPLVCTPLTGLYYSRNNHFTLTVFYNLMPTS